MMTILPSNGTEPSTAEDLQDASDLPASELGSDTQENGMTRSQALNLYTSHFLSTWNVRTYVRTR
jgi:iron-regulated transporter 1